ncbi:beta-galactosidase-like precursor, partial [Trifolium pratense]
GHRSLFAYLPAYSSEDDSIIADALWKQINVTGDSSDYLWYLTE